VVRALAEFGVRRPVVANLVMFALIAAGLIFGINARKEFFPETRASHVIIAAPYPGASPTEVEDSLAVKIEDRIASLDDVEEITTTVSEGLATIVIEFDEGSDISEKLFEVKREIDALQDLPEESQRITVDKLEPNLPVINLSLFGDIDERVMKQTLQEIRDDLDRIPSMGQISVGGLRTDEILVEVDPASLLEHRLSLPQISAVIRQSMIELPGGSVRSSTSNVAIRTVGAEEKVSEIREIIVKRSPDGSLLRLGDIARIESTFADIDLESRLNGKPAASLTVFKVGAQDAVKMAEAVKAYAKGRTGEPIELTWRESLSRMLSPPASKPENDEQDRSTPDGAEAAGVDLSGVSDRLFAYELGREAYQRGPLPAELAVTTDLSRFIVGRLELLSRNALQGGILVLITLILLLNLRVAFWVAIGLVVSLLGTLALMYVFEITLNLLTMFGLIIVVGLLVDDAIVVSENIMTRHERGEDPITAAIEGTKQVGWPVITTVLTTICAFLPLALIQGQIGDLLEVLPLVVVCALSISLIECLFILPSHMAHSLQKAQSRRLEHRQGFFTRVEARFDTWREHLIHKKLIPAYVVVLRRAMHFRYISLGLGLCLVIVSLGMVAGGRVGFEFFEASDSETVRIDLNMPIGTPIDVTDRYVRQIESACFNQPEITTTWGLVGQTQSMDSPLSAEQTHLGQLILELKPVEERDRSSEQVMQSIRDELGVMPGIRSLRMASVAGGPDGAAITLSAVGDNPDVLLEVVGEIKALLATIQDVVDIGDDSDLGRRELRLSLLDGADELGFTTENVARQIRGAVFGLEAHTFPGEREDVDVRVTLPQSARRSLASIEELHLFSPGGVPVPLREVVDVTETKGYATIRRLDRERLMTVTADVRAGGESAEKIMAAIRPDLAEIDAKYAGVRIEERGRQEDMKESFATLPIGFVVACGLIYVILTWLFSSYIKPLIVLTAVPFAIVGMIWGHYFLGFTMTFLSLIGFVALAGVVVNDSLIFIEFFSRMRESGQSVTEAAINAGRARLRAILLTTITTVLGLLPLMLEQSFQARFLIPMAITITCGLLSATVIILVLLPCLLAITDDIQRTVYLLWNGRPRPDPYPEIHEKSSA